jgi:hypothetical protein
MNNKYEPDQNNSNSKVKYFLDTRTFNQSLTSSNNQLLDNIIMDTQYTRNKDNWPLTQESKNKLESNFDSKYFPSSLLDVKVNKSTGLQFDYANKINIENDFKNISTQECKTKSTNNCKTHDRRRNLDYSNYILPGSMTNSGFGNLNDLSKIKYGDSTRDMQGSIRDAEIDRFHFTYRNYQHEVYGSNPLPGDTRYLNKKF